jgi:hypothetical protein
VADPTEALHLSCSEFRRAPVAADPGIDCRTTGPLEVRWFVPGALPRSLWRPDERPRVRVDAYDDESLRPTASLKRRGLQGPWEHKRCVERVHVPIFGSVVTAEAWTKDRLGGVRSAGRVTLVCKRIWRRSGLEVVDLEVDGERWWSVAVKVEPFVRVPSRFEPLGVAAASRGRTHSYPSWLLSR